VTQRLLSAGQDKTVRVWDAKTGACEKVLTGHGALLVDMCKVGEDRIATVAEDKTVRIWNAVVEWPEHLDEPSPYHVPPAFGTCERTLLVCPSYSRAHGAWVRCIAASTDGELFVTGSDDCDIRVCSMEGQCVSTLRGHRDAVYSVCVADDATGIMPKSPTVPRSCEDLLLSGSRDGDVRMWDLRRGVCLSILTGHKSWVLSVTRLAPNVFASTSANSQVKMWEWRPPLLDTLECGHTFVGHDDGVTCAVLLNDTLVSADSDDNLMIWA